MPFTLSHPAVVLPIVRSGTPASGLVLGSMIPDLPMFGLVPYGYGLAHSVRGIVTVDLLVGTTAALLWIGLVRAAVISALPERLRTRTRCEAMTRRAWLLLPVGVTAGALTHVAWDELTHAGRWGARHVAWLSSDHLGYAGYHWAQATSSALGLSIVIAYAVRTIVRRPRVLADASMPRLARWLMTAVLAVTAVVGAVFVLGGMGRGLHAAAIAAAVHSLGVLAVATLVAAVVWQVVASPPRGQRPTPGDRATQ